MSISRGNHTLKVVSFPKHRHFSLCGYNIKNQHTPCHVFSIFHFGTSYTFLPQNKALSALDQFKDKVSKRETKLIRQREEKEGGQKNNKKLERKLLEQPS